MLLPIQAANAQDARVGLRNMPVFIAESLRAFRQTSHYLADAMALNFEGDNLGRPNGTPVPFNFDPASHLLYRLVDFNADGQPEAVLVFFWNQVALRGALPGVVMQRVSGSWRFACEFTYDENQIVLLGGRTRGWRRFRAGGNVMEWRRPADGPPSARECHPRPGPVRLGAGG